MASAQLSSYLAQHIPNVDAVIREHLYSEVGLVRSVAEYIVNSGGKRLRPALTVLASQSCKPGAAPDAVYRLAAVIELIHTATLLHDDVVDGSVLRRGNPTANAEFGNAASVLVGDFLYSRAFQMMVSVDNMRTLQIISDATNVIAEGEVLQLMHAGDPELDEENHLKVIRFKTAKLFEAAARIGAVVADAPPAFEFAIAQYGMHLGTAFQLVDDILDYTGDKQAIGKNLGDDLAEGKMTLPLIRTLKVAALQQRATIIEAIQAPERADFATVVEIVRSTDALQYASECAKSEASRASAAIESLPPSQAKDVLLELSLFAVTRNH